MILATLLFCSLAAPQQSFFHAPDRSLGAPAPLLNHGPSTTGGGSSVLSGETLRAGRWSLDWRTDYTAYEHIPLARAKEIAADHGHFDSLDSSLLTALSLAYGLTNDLQLAAQLGWYRGSDFLDAHTHGGPVVTDTGDPSGLTDLWLNAKYRVLRGSRGHLAVVGGLKLPTGVDDEVLEGGHDLEPSSQPGSGAVDWQAGVAYSRFLDPATTLDASAVFTFRGEEDGFEVGDRTDLGVAIARRLSGGPAASPGWTVFGEALVVVLQEDAEDEVLNDDSGGTALFLTPGLRYRFANGVAATLAPSFPVSQNWNGEQIETDLKVTLVVSFDW